MKFKALLLAFAVAGLGASFGLTDTGRSDTGTGTTTTGDTTTTSATTTTTTSSDGCNRFELHGTLGSVSASSFTVNVTKGNHEAKGITGTTVTIAVTADTRVSWSGRGTLTGPNQGDSVNVNGKLCGTTLTASKVEARGPKPAGSGGDAKKHDSGSTTTTTTTTSGSEGSNGKDHGKHK
jgi:hypothetical protein